MKVPNELHIPSTMKFDMNAAKTTTHPYPPSGADTTDFSTSPPPFRISSAMNNHTCVCVYLCASVRVSACACARAFVCVAPMIVCMCVCVSVHTYMGVFGAAFLYICVGAYICVLLHVYAHMGCT